MFARFGGDEFALLLPDTGRDKAYEVVQRFCLALASAPVEFGGRSVAITVSAGIAGLANEADCLDALLKRADQALYQAKAAGRNRVMVEPTAE